MSFEEEFNSFFNGDESLYNKIGEAKARQILEVLKAMVKEDEDNNIQGFQLLSPFQRMNVFDALEENSKTLGEPSEIIEGFEDGNFVTKKIWRDADGKVTNLEIIIKDGPSNESDDADSMDFGGLNLDGIKIIPLDLDNLPNDFPSDLGMVLGQIFGGKMPSGGLSSRKPKKERTLEELLEAVVAVEEYDTAALIRDCIAKDKTFVETFKREMGEATELLDIQHIKKLTGLFEENAVRIQRLIDENEHYFEN